MQAIDPVASVSRATGKQAWPTRHKRVTLTVRQDDPPGTTELFTSWATCAVFFWLSLFSLNMSQAWHGQCMCFATGCPQTSEARRWTYGCNSTDTRIEHGFLHGVRRPMALALLFLTTEQFFIKTSWSYSTSPSQERLARRLFSCRGYGCRGTRRPRRFVSSSADVTAVARATNICMKLRETSTSKTRKLRPSAELHFGLTCKGRTLSWISKNSHKLHDSFSPVESLFKI